MSIEAVISTQVIDTTFVGLSDMQSVKPREYTLENLKKDLRI
jgi:hypothetical protein